MSDARATTGGPAIDQTRRRRDARVGRWLFGAVLLTCVYFFPLYDADANARLDLALSLVVHHTIQVDAYHTNTTDLVRYKGHYYSIQAPGQSLAGVPFTAVFTRLTARSGGKRSVEKIGSSDEGRVPFFFLLYFGTILSVGLVSALFLRYFWRFLGHVTESRSTRLMVTLGLFAGTAVLPYSTVFYSHVPAMALLFAGFALIYLLTGASNRSTWVTRRPEPAALLAGLCLGGAQLYEYPAIVIVAVLGLYALVRLPRRLVALLILGAVPGYALLLGYDWLAFGNPLSTGYGAHSLSYGQAYAGGPGGLSILPSPEALWGMSFSPYRGLFFMSPFLLLAIPGVVEWSRRGLPWLVPTAVFILYFLAIAMYPIWYAGSSIGPRLLIPILPFLCLLVASGIDFMRARGWAWLAYISIGLSAVVVLALTLGSVRAFPSSTEANPLFHDAIPSLLHNRVIPNVGAALIGPLVGTSSLATVVPLLICLGVWSAIAFRPRRGTRKLETAPSAMGALPTSSRTRP